MSAARRMVLVLQPEGSSLCGETCVAMVAGITVGEAMNIVGGNGTGTHTRHIVAALRALRIKCADKLRRVSRLRPVLPARAIVSAVQYIRKVEGGRRGQRRAHWMLTWDGKIYDPGGRWPEGYNGWTITSYLDLT